MYGGLSLVLGVFGVALLFLVLGAFFIRKISGGAASARSIVVKPFKIIVAPFHTIRVAAVFVFVVVGIAFLLMAPYYVVYQQVTGYRYSLEVTRNPLRYIDAVCNPVGANPETGAVSAACRFIARYTLDRAVTGASLIETPVYTTYVNMLLRPDYVLLGLVFLIAGAILTAYFLAKSNTEAAKAAGTWVERPD